MNFYTILYSLIFLLPYLNIHPHNPHNIRANAAHFKIHSIVSVINPKK